MTQPGHLPDDALGYDAYIERMRQEEYPMLKDALYLDHAGTTLYSKTQMERFNSDMMANLYGNPHSASPSSQTSTSVVENIRWDLMRFFNADPEHFDLVFTANATAAIKLVANAFRELEGGFEYLYHAESHTSVVGVRELARTHRCLESDAAVVKWIEGVKSGREEMPKALFAYPAQSNMNGRRLPLTWPRQVISAKNPTSIYTLLDVAAYASTTPLDLSNAYEAPDFTVLSLYKIFGFPDLGALIVKKSASHIFEHRRYFGGGTVDMVACRGEQWHARKSGMLHNRLEDGTLPIHSILALKSAMRTLAELFGSLDLVSRHTTALVQELYNRLSALTHSDGAYLCRIYKHDDASYGDSNVQGPVIAFNLRDSRNNWVSNTEVEKLASVKNIHIRTGGVCNPGGVALALDLAPWELRENFSAGHRCGSENDVLHGKPTGVIRVSLGAMSTRSDVNRFLAFIEEFFLCKIAPGAELRPSSTDRGHERFYVESLNVYPIKSCGGWTVPAGLGWDVRPEGLAWDREWCVVHQGTGKALSQKQHPCMALVRPSLDLKAGLLRMKAAGSGDEVTIPLSRNPAWYDGPSTPADAQVCEDEVKVFAYRSLTIAEFFTRVIGVPCTLARHNPGSSTSRHSKLHLTADIRRQNSDHPPRPIALSNESPILTISRSSLNRLNEEIKSTSGKAAHPSVFRANVVLAEDPLLAPGSEQPWVEDNWHSMQIRDRDGPTFRFLGGCRRCQMVCVDQESAEKNAEPFATLSKTRRFGGRVLFGVHTTLCDKHVGSTMVRVGDAVKTWSIGDDTSDS